MISSDFALIKSLEITTKKLVSGPLLGDARSTLKGSGFEFHQLREYVQGDDIRFIDWKSSARSNKMLVRQYLEDRNRTVFIVVDISASTEYGTHIVRTHTVGTHPMGAHIVGSNTLGTHTVLKSDLIKQLAGILAFVALHRKDSVGLILFSDENEKIIPPRNSRAHVYSLVNTLFSYKPKHRTTNINVPLEYLARLRGQKALVCFISDFMGDLDPTALSLVARHHDLLVFRCLDEREVHFPNVGSLLMQDSETDIITEIEGEASALSDALTLWHRHQNERFVSAKVDSLDLIAGKPFSGDLVRFLRTRIYG